MRAGRWGLRAALSTRVVAMLGEFVVCVECVEFVEFVEFIECVECVESGEFGRGFDRSGW
jgi:hypothetical protein